MEFSGNKELNRLYFEIFHAPIKENEGKIIGVSVYVKDSIEKNDAFYLFKESEARFRILFEQSPDAIILVDLVNEKIIDANQKAAKLFKCEKNELIGMHHNSMHPQFNETCKHESFIDHIAESHLLDANYLVNSSILALDGTVIPVEIIPQIIRIGDNDLFLGTLRDITERKNAEEKLFESELFFRESQRAAGIGSYKLDIQTGMWTSSEVLDGIFGIDSNYERSVSGWSELIFEDDKEMMNNHFAVDVLEKRMPSNKEYRIKRISNGEIRWVHGLGKLVFDEKNQLIAIFGTIQDITERKIADESIRKSEERLNRAELASKSGNWELLVESGIIKASKGACKVYGLNSEDFVYEKIKIIPLKEYRPLLDLALKNLIQKGEPYNIEFKIKTVDTGEMKVIHSSAVYDADRGVVFGVIRDITAQKEAESALHESEERFKVLFENAPDAMFLADTETRRIIDANISACHLFKKEKNELIGLYQHELHPERNISKTKDDFDTHIIKSINTATSLLIENTIITSEGIEIPVEILGQSIKIGKKELLLGTFRDITERKKAENALRDNEQKLSALFNGMSEMTVIHEMIFDVNNQPVNYRILDCNPSFTHITGIARENAIGHLATEVYGTEQAPYLTAYAGVCHTGMNYEFQTYFSPLDKHFLISAVSIGENRFATITADITDIQKVQEIVLEKNKELENYMYVASHDLRSPLVNIQGFSQRLENQIDELLMQFRQNHIELSNFNDIEKTISQNIHKSLNFILNNVAKMDTLINGLLQLSRTGQIQLNIQKINVKQLIDKVLKTFDYQLTACNAKIQLYEIHNCRADENQINQLFSNLINNAYKYRAADRQLKIEITSVVQFNKVIYSISDNGIGIEESKINRIWDMFYRIDPVNDEKGEGLGLSLAKQIAGKNNGKIWVESKIGIGSTFFVELPSVV
jgi:PAS domain S-box-containing protein